MNKNNEKGIALIIAIILGALLVGITATIGSLIGRDILLASSNERSAEAFAMADMGIECALYADFVDGTVATNTPGGTTVACGGDAVKLEQPPGPANSDACLTGLGAKCDCQNRPLRKDVPSPGAATSSFWYGAGFGNAGACGCVDVGKRYEKINGVDVMVTTVEARGYSTCDISDPSRVERALRATY